MKRSMYGRATLAAMSALFLAASFAPISADAQGTPIGLRLCRKDKMLCKCSGHPDEVCKGNYRLDKRGIPVVSCVCPITGRRCARGCIPS
jgi:hypothetical protein